MEILLFILGVVLIIAGILGSFLPVMPGVPLSWLGLLMLYLIPEVPMNYIFLGITLGVAALVYILNFVLPAAGTKRYGGSKQGAWGTTIGLVIGFLTPVPFGMLIGAILGAFIGEITHRNHLKSALRATWGSILGFLGTSLVEFAVAVIFLFMFLYRAWQFREIIF